MTWILLIASVVLAMVDSVVTRKRLTWELNPLVRWLSVRLAPTPSVLLGVMLPQVCWAFGLAHYLPCGLAIFVGFQSHRTYLQYLSRNFKLPGWDAKSLPSLRQSLEPGVPPPPRSNHPGSPLEQGSTAAGFMATFGHPSAATKPC